jgi:hypothetical protein
MRAFSVDEQTACGGGREEEEEEEEEAAAAAAAEGMRQGLKTSRGINRQHNETDSWFCFVLDFCGSLKFCIKLTF